MPQPEKPEHQPPYHTLSENELLAALDVTVNGLTSEQVQARLERYGHNDISSARKRPVILQFLEHFKNLLVIILLFAAAISLVVGEITNAAIIAVIVIASVTLDFFQEYKAGNANLTRVNQAQSDLVRAEADLASSRVNLENAKAQMEAAIGSR